MAISIGATAAGNSASATSLGITFSTINAGEIVLIAFTANTAPTVSVTASGLTFTKRAGPAGTLPFVIEIWTAVASSTASSVTVTCTQTSAGFITVQGMCIAGANTSTIFDPNAACPSAVNSGNATISTDNANDILIGASRMSATASPTQQASWTKVYGQNFALLQYIIVSATQSSLTVAPASGENNGNIADAIMAVNDALIDGGDLLDVNVTQFGGTNATTSGGRPEVNTTHAAGTAWGSGAITAASIASDAITAAKVAADVGTEIGTAVWASTTRQLTGTQTFDLTGSITGNLSGSVGSVTGNVGGNVAGSVGSVAAGGITASSIAADAIGASELAADAVAEIAGAVWDITLASHLTGGTTGNALNAAGSAGDPWSTALPGAYSAGSAGYIMGTNLNATVSSRLASASYTAPLDAAGTRSAVGLASANLDTQLDALPTATENADALLKRDWSSVTGEAARSALNALRFLRNKWALSGGTVTVYKEDDATTAWSGSATTAASDPVSSIDPS